MSTNLELDIDQLIVLADLHSCSQYAPFPDKMLLLGGNVVRPNEFQRWLNRCWGLFWDWVDGETAGGKTAVAVLGDSTEGVHHGGKELVSHEPTDHINAAVALLQPHLKGRKLVMVEGTDCHDGQLENAIGAALGAIPYRKPGKTKAAPGLYAWPQVNLNVRNCHGILRHHIATTIRPYLEASALSIQLGSDRIEALRARQAVPQFLVSAHRHRLGGYTDGDAQVVVVPPWQGLTRHGRKVVPHARCHVGGAILDFRRAGKYDPPMAAFKRFVP